MLRDCIRVLRRGAWWILLVVVVIVSSALLHSLGRTPVYQSEAEVAVRPFSLSPTQGRVNVLVDMETERRLASSVDVATRAFDRRGADGAASAGVSVHTTGTAQTLLFRAFSPSPMSARTSAQAHAEAYLELREEQVREDLQASAGPLAVRTHELATQAENVQRQLSTAATEADRKALEIQFYSLVTQQALLEEKQDSLIRPGNLDVGRIIVPADLPTSPVLPDHRRAAGLAFLVAVAFGVGAAFAHDRLDRRLGRERLLELLHTPVLGEIPRFRPVKERHVVLVELLARPESPASEAYRTLRADLFHQLQRRRLKTLLVTSATGGEGKTTTAMNLGAAMARAGRRVVIVSEAPESGLDRYLPAGGSGGHRTPVPSRRTRAVPTLERVGVEGLLVVPDGLATHPVQTAASQLERLVDLLQAVADTVIIDGRPVLRGGGTTLAGVVDAVLVVASDRRTAEHSVRDAKVKLDNVCAPVVGAILNEHDPRAVGRRVPSIDLGPAGATDVDVRSSGLTGVPAGSSTDQGTLAGTRTRPGGAGRGR